MEKIRCRLARCGQLPEADPAGGLRLSVLEKLVLGPFFFLILLVLVLFTWSLIVLAGGQQGAGGPIGLIAALFLS
ncbi:hypothetical protein [Desulfogranum mediterraneum]|uniref:hypothetical protein n=1 Tax=Desulfogranum mediterraneum TaxID=160661 RepID=UPI0003FFE39A|nr:hypothetical protein [Desulfogranum mediterraneum]